MNSISQLYQYYYFKLAHTKKGILIELLKVRETQDCKIINSKKNASEKSKQKINLPIWEPNFNFINPL